MHAHVVDVSMWNRVIACGKSVARFKLTTKKLMNTTSSNVHNRPSDTIDGASLTSARTANVNVSRVSWGAILAGAVIAMAIMFLLTLLGVAVGAAAIDPGLDANPIAGVPISSGIFLIVAQLLSLGVGGYVAARLAGIPLKPASMLHGAAVWAIATFGLLYMATSTVGNIAGGAASMVTSAGKGLASATASVIPDDMNLEGMSIDSLPAEVTNALDKRDLTLSDLREQAMASMRDVVSQDEQSNAGDEAKEALTELKQSPMQAQEITSDLMDNLFGGTGAVLSAEDKQQSIEELSDAMGISAEEAQKQIDQWQSAASDAVDEAQASFEAAKKASVDAAQSMSEGVATAALMAFLASLIGLIAAVAGAAFGRPKDTVLV